MKSWSFENPFNSQWGGVFERYSNMMRDPKNQLHPWSFRGGTPISRGVFFRFNVPGFIRRFIGGYSSMYN